MTTTAPSPMKTSEIMLVRHGLSAMNLEHRWLTASGLRETMAEYHRHGIAPHSHPSDSLRADAREVKMILCSDLPRSIESAQRLGADQPEVNPLVREAGWPPRGSWGSIPLPSRLWMILSVVLWHMGLWTDGETVREARQRAVAATDWLESQASEHARILVVGHGIFNRLLALELRRRGWEGPKRPGSKNWDATVYRKARPL